jgi:hypothetical protein
MRTLAPAIVFTLVAHSAFAQAEGCTYDECALKVTQSLFGRSILQGTSEQRVARIFFFAPDIPLFTERADSAAYYYRAFRSQQNRGTWFLIAGSAAFFSGALLASRDETVGITLSVAGFGAFVVSIIETVSGFNKLSRAVWWYNRELH